MKDKIKKILMFIGFITAIIGAIMVTFEMENEIGVASYLPAIFATCFIFAKNDVVKYFGYAIAGVNIATGILYVGYEETMIVGVGLIIMALSSILYLLEIIFGFFGFSLNKGKNNNCYNESKDDFQEIETYAQMLAEGILTESEFEDLKKKIFSIEKKKGNSIDDLKKWKKLLDQQVITEEEFSAIKAKVFQK